MVIACANACMQIHVIHAPSTHMWRACCVGSPPISFSTLFSRLHVCACTHVHYSTCGSQVTTFHEFIFSLLHGFRESKSSSCFHSDHFYLLSHTTSPPSYLFWDMVSQWSCNSPKQQAAASAKNPLVWVTPVLGITGAHNHTQVCKGHWGTELSSSYLHSKDWTIWVISPPGCFYTWLFVPGCSWRVWNGVPTIPSSPLKQLWHGTKTE